MKRIMFFILALCSLDGLITSSKTYAKENIDQRDFMSAIEGLNPQQVARIIKKQKGNKAAIKNLVAPPYKLDDQPLNVAVKTYWNLGKRQATEQAQKKRVAPDFLKILILLVNNGANLKDLEIYAQKNGNYYEPVIAEFYNSRVFTK